MRGLELAGIRAGYQSPTGEMIEVLHDISLSVNPQEIWLLLGANGSGKSTLLKLAAGLLKPFAGKVTLAGKEVLPATVGMVFQHPRAQLFADSIFEDCAFGPRNLGVDEEQVKNRVTRALVAVGLDEKAIAAKSPFSLSGGQARRVAIAGILALEPAAYCFDEPTAGLDAHGRREFIVLLKRLKSQGAATMIAGHDMDDLLPVATHVCVLQAGKAIWQGTKDAFIAHPDVLEQAGLEQLDFLAFQDAIAHSRGVALQRSLDPFAVWQQLAAEQGNDAS